jgi:DNA-directed RNA polymerase sigma subunit (sigma70/sigma32)
LPQSKQREARANQLDVRVAPDALSRARSTETEEVGQQFSLTRKRIRQIEAKALILRPIS